MKTQKKSQITIFIVIGIILILVISFLFLNGQFEFFQSSDTKMKNQVADIVETCIEDYADTGVFLLGFQGGRILIDEFISSNPDRYVDFGYKIPNWDTEVNDIPTIESMEAELNRFIEFNAYSCIVNNLRALDEFLEIDVGDSMDVDATINRENVMIDTDIEVRFSQKNSDEVLTVEDYFVSLDGVRLGDLYTLAAKIYNLEARTYFLEELILDQIYSASDYSDRQYSMPSEGMRFSCSKQYWTIPELKKILANLNNNNFKYLQIVGTRSIQDVFDANLREEYGTFDDRAYFEKNYVYRIEDVEPSYINYGVEFMMPSTEITGREGFLQRYPYREFEVTPSSGEIVTSMNLEPDSNALMPIPCIQIYHHLYDLDYDIMVKITDYNDDAQNYFFQFPARVLIKSNTPKQRPFDIITTEPPTVTNENYCADESKQYPFILYVADASTGDYLDGVNISYKCLNLECDIGQTKKPLYRGVERKYADPYLDELFPYCYQGQVIAEMEGFHTAKMRINTDESLLVEDDMSYEELQMIPVKEFKVDVSTFLMVNRETGLGERVYSEKDGSIFASIENEPLDFSTQAVWPNEEGFLDTMQFLDMEGVAYNVTVIFMDEDFNLRGFFELENWVPENIHQGNNLRFKIPSSVNVIEEDDYMEFYEYMNNIMMDEFLSYGVNFR